jgi:hypothetical protein
LFDFDIEILKFTSLNQLKSAVIVSTIQEVIYASSLNAGYIIPSKKILAQTQIIAEHYMYDSKILATIEQNCELESIALMRIDGVIYKNIFIK